ncbi:hypothetical protein [Mesonia aquimarina]|uniref:hypothetical protein n=1 Tax=Mesonia aquimarina TaxID=1504967 RepID=UPI000EF58545|nr:hypothetical protein [Mesonia aquimarina]
MENFKKNPFTTIIGIAIAVIGVVLMTGRYFFDLKQDVELWQSGVIIAVGLLIMRAQDDLIDILTLGLKSLIQKHTK